MNTVPEYINPANPRGRRYYVCFTNPQEHCERLWSSPWQAGPSWACLRGWGIAELRKALPEFLKTFQASAIDVYPGTNGKSAVASLKREQGTQALEKLNEAREDLERCYREHEHEREECGPEFGFYQSALLNAREEGVSNE